ncbi:LexA family transcriptional regulator [Azospirillum sp. A26]|uniref:helix-turn-helix domain-containing protein n=1 Tax=Azospirillum sp. A26 TaxID=3160607 RepID=UPI0036712C33
MSKLADIRASQRLSQGELAKRVGTTQSQIAKLENGQRSLSLNWAARLAPHLGVKPQALLMEDSQIALLMLITNDAIDPVDLSPDATEPSPPQSVCSAGTITVFTFTTARPPIQGRFPLQAAPVGTALTPPCLNSVEDAYGVRVADTRMAPRFTPRQTLYVHPRQSPVPEVGVLIRLSDGTACVREWRGWTDDGDLLLHSYNPAETVTLPGGSVVDVHVIVGLEEGL